MKPETPSPDSDEDTSSAESSEAQVNVSVPASIAATAAAMEQTIEDLKSSIAGSSSRDPIRVPAKVYDYLARSLIQREDAAKAERDVTHPRSANKISATTTKPTRHAASSSSSSKDSRYFYINDEVEDKHALMHVTPQQQQRMSRRCHVCEGPIPFYEDFDSDTYAPTRNLPCEL